MTNKIPGQIIDNMETGNANIVMFNAFLSAEAQILQNQTVMFDCFMELIDDEKHRDLLDKYIHTNNILINFLMEVVNQNNVLD